MNEGEEVEERERQTDRKNGLKNLKALWKETDTKKRIPFLPNFVHLRFFECLSEKR